MVEYLAQSFIDDQIVKAAHRYVDSETEESIMVEVDRALAPACMGLVKSATRNVYDAPDGESLGRLGRKAIAIGIIGIDDAVTVVERDQAWL